MSASRRKHGLAFKAKVALTGSQFTDDDFTGVLLAHGVAVSMDGRGGFADNIFVERLWRSLKYEEVYLKAYENVAEARQGIAAYFEFYNHQRLRQALAYRTRARSSTKRRDLPVRRGGKTLARAQHHHHNEIQTWAGFSTFTIARSLSRRSGPPHTCIALCTILPGTTSVFF
jgi:hypothetical protein